MNPVRLFWADLRKQKWSFLLLMAAALPVGANTAMVLDMGLRYESYLYPRALEQGMTSWQTLLIEHHHILMWGAFLPIFVALIAALVYYPEFRQGGWKQLNSLPVSRLEVYLSKWAAILFFVFWILVLDALGLALVGLLFRFPEPLPWDLLGQYAGYQFITAAAIAALHNWLSSYSKNLIAPVGAAFAGMIVSYTLFYSHYETARWFFYAYPIFAGDQRYGTPPAILITSLLLTAVFLAAGWLEFRRRDIA